jgi:hypothetical protein
MDLNFDFVLVGFSGFLLGLVFNFYDDDSMDFYDDDDSMGFLGCWDASMGSSSNLFELVLPILLWNH